jgi:hypothetical protein
MPPLYRGNVRFAKQSGSAADANSANSGVQFRGSAPCIGEGYARSRRPSRRQRADRLGFHPAVEAAEPMQEGLSLDRDYEMREGRERTVARGRHRSRRANRRSSWLALAGNGAELVPGWLSDLQSAFVSLFPFAEPKSAVILDLALRSRKRFADMAARGPSQRVFAVTKRRLPDTCRTPFRAYRTPFSP